MKIINENETETKRIMDNAFESINGTMLLLEDDYLNSLKSNDPKIHPKIQEVAINLINGYKSAENCLYTSMISTFLGSFNLNIEKKNFVFNKNETDVINNLFEKWPKIQSANNVSYADYNNFKKDVISLQNPPLHIDKDGMLYKIFLTHIEDAFELSKRESILNNFRVKINSFLRKNNFTNLIIQDNTLTRIEPIEFEYLIARLFNLMNYETDITPATGDYGIDVFAKKDNETIAIQCKKYNENIKVSNREIQMFLGAIQLKGFTITRGIFITTSDFTDQAYRQADGNKIELWNGNKLNKIMNEYLLKGEFK